MGSRLAAALSVALLAAPVLRAQAVVPFSAPVLGPDRSLPSACVERGDERVCRITVADDGAGAVVVTRGGRETARWRAPVPGLYQDVRAFRIGRTLVVGVLDAVSNGLGVSTWTLHVLFPDARQPAYSFTVEELGVAGGSFSARHGRTVVWATEWIGMPDPAGRRVPGTYVVGRPFYIEAEGLVPANDLPIRARRLLAGFEREFVAGVGEPRDWLTHRRAETLRMDPALVGPARTTRGQVTSAVWDASEFDEALVVTILTDAGGTPRLRSGYDASLPTLRYVGADATGRLWPLDYRPADVSAWLVGRRFHFESRGDTRSGVLWRE